MQHLNLRISLNNSFKSLSVKNLQASTQIIQSKSLEEHETAELVCCNILGVTTKNACKELKK